MVMLTLDGAISICTLANSPMHWSTHVPGNPFHISKHGASAPVLTLAVTLSA